MLAGSAEELLARVAEVQEEVAVPCPETLKLALEPVAVLTRARREPVESLTTLAVTPIEAVLMELASEESEFEPLLCPRLNIV